MYAGAYFGTTGYGQALFSSTVAIILTEISEAILLGVSDRAPAPMSIQDNTIAIQIRTL